MEPITTWLNATMCFFISVALICAVLNPHIHDGILIKLGCIAMVLGFGTIGWHMTPLGHDVRPMDLIPWQRSILIINVGIAIVIFGYLLRRLHEKHPLRRLTDWDDSEIAK